MIRSEESQQEGKLGGTHQILFKAILGEETISEKKTKRGGRKVKLNLNSSMKIVNVTGFIPFPLFIFQATCNGDEREVK